MNLRLTIIGVATIGLGMAQTIDAHEIKLLSRSTSFNTALIVNPGSVGHSFGGSNAPDDLFAIRLSFNSDYGGFIFAPLPTSGSGSAQQSGDARFTLEWIPEGPTDVPSAAEYSLLVDVYVTLGSSGGAQMPFPPAQIFLSTIGQAPGRSTQATGMAHPSVFDPGGATGLEWASDLPSGRVLVQENYPVTVVFKEQKDGRFVGTAKYNAAYQASFYHQSYGTFTGPFGQSVYCLVRAKAKECAGVPVEQP